MDLSNLSLDFGNIGIRPWSSNWSTRSTSITLKIVDNVIHFSQLLIMLLKELVKVVDSFFQVFNILILFGVIDFEIANSIH